LNKNVKSLGFYGAILAVLILVLAMMYKDQPDVSLSYAKTLDLIRNEQVQSLTVEGSNLTMNLKDGTTVTKNLPSFALFYEDVGELVEEQYAEGIIEDYDYPAPPEIPWWVSMLPYVILGGVMIFLWVYMMGNAGGGGGKMMSFGRAKVRTMSENQRKVTFQDVAGADEEKEELWEVVDFLKSPKRFTDLGARIPKGILMVGPPGTGKTLLAKAVAGEAGVSFFSISGSDFVEMFVGVGASRVRDLFDQAKKNSPCIVFIDEIDAVGRQRGTGMGGGHDEREQTLNQLLVEMDGFGVNEGVIVVAATNRADVLDPALTRPGRFDRQVYVYLPDMRGREAILRVHSRGKPLDADVDLKKIAGGTIGFSGADLENLMNEAALLAARRGKLSIGMSEVSEATIKVMMGPAKKSKVPSEKVRRLTAYHEGGHALIHYYLDKLDDVHEVTITPRGPAGGYTLALPTEEKDYGSRLEMLDELVSLLGGRVAEQLVLGDISTGASSDIQRATQIARDMVMRYGMSETLGPIVYGHGHNDPFLGRDFSMDRGFSETTAAQIDQEIKDIIENAYARCEEILTQHRDRLEAVAQALLERETLNGVEFRMVMEGKTLPPPRKEENDTPHATPNPDVPANGAASSSLPDRKDIVEELREEIRNEDRETLQQEIAEAFPGQLPSAEEKKDDDSQQEEKKDTDK
jgi:cell division protease FtsH